jgi:heat shock protein HslJ
MRYRSSIRISITAVALLLTLAACGRADAPSGQAGPATPPTNAPAAGAPTALPGGQGGAQDDLAGTKWLLASFGTPDSHTAVPPEAGVTAEFAVGGQLGGSAGCNSYSARWTRNGQAFTVGEIVQTEMACLDENAMAREQAFLSALQSARSIARDADTLTIGYDGGELRFTRLQPPQDRPLEGTAWQLTTFVSGDVAASLLSDTRITAEFAQGKVSGTAGCNQYFGSYSLSGNTIAFGELGSTKKACPGDIMKQEQDFLAALGSATAFSIAGDQLTVAYPGGSLVFSGGAPAQ